MPGELPSRVMLAASLPSVTELAHVLEMSLEGGLVTLTLSESPPQAEFDVTLSAAGVDAQFIISASVVGVPLRGAQCCAVKLSELEQVVDVQRFLLAHTEGAPPAPNLESGAIRARADPLVGRRIAAKYEVETLLGSGAMGKVYRARHLALDRPVALKVLHGTFVQEEVFVARFHREARSASKLDHANVTRVLDFGEEAEDGLLYIVMELLSGRNLRVLLDQTQRMPLEKTVDVMSQVCAGLSVAHERGIVHRDIKPGNIVLVPGQDDDGLAVEVAKVCDFGLATIQDSRGDTAAQRGGRARTAAGAVCGTPDYMSPEQGKGEPADHRSDIYSCGALLYEMVTGQVPFPKPTAIAAVMAHIVEPPKPPSSHADVDPRLDAVILKALSKDPKDRHQSVRELRSELRAVLRSNVAEPSASGMRPRLPPTERIETPMPIPVLEVPASRSMRAAPAEKPSVPEIDASAERVSFSPGSLRTGERGLMEIDEETNAPALELAVPQRASWTAAARSAPVLVAPKVPLDDPSSRFAELLTELFALVNAHSQGRLDRSTLERAAYAVTRIVDALLRLRAELTILRRDAHDATVLQVTTAAGERGELPRLLGRGKGASVATVLSDLFVRRRILSITFRDHLPSGELSDLVELLAESEPTEATRARIRSATRVAVLFPADLVGRARGLDWPLDLAVSRLCRDLRALGSARVHAAGIAERAGTAITDAMRAVPDDLTRAFVGELDLVRACLAGVPPLANVDPLDSMVAGLREATSVQMAKDGVAALRRGEEADRALLEALARRFLRERTPESDPLLAPLAQVSVLKFADLPEDVRAGMKWEDLADRVARDPQKHVDAVVKTLDPSRFAEEAHSLVQIGPILARRGEVGAIHAILVGLHRLSKGSSPEPGARPQTAAKALRELFDARVIATVAESLLTGQGGARSPAFAILMALGLSGAKAICVARKKLGGERSVRTRFVESLREMGPRALPVLTESLLAIDPNVTEQETAALAEDLLRSLPSVVDERTASVTLRFLGHAAPAVRRACAGVLPGLAGPSARSALLSLLGDRDDAVRIAALTGLRTLGGVDAQVLPFIDQMLRPSTPVSDELRAVAAAVLSEATPAARSAAGTLLRRALQPKERGLFGSGSGESALLVVALARSLLAIGGEEGRRFVEQRMSQTSPEIREHLRKLLEKP